MSGLFRLSEGDNDSETLLVFVNNKILCGEGGYSCVNMNIKCHSMTNNLARSIRWNSNTAISLQITHSNIESISGPAKDNGNPVVIN